MARIGRGGIAAAGLTLVVGLAAGPVGAQVAWDAPMLLSDGSPAGFGVHVFDPHPGDGIGVLGTWRAREAPVGPGFRLALAEDARGDLAVAGGVDVSGDILVSDLDPAVGLVWFAGAGLGVGDDVLVSLPLGVAISFEVEGDGIFLRPYGSPRVVLDLFGGEGEGEDDLDLDAAVDLGVDLSFDSRWIIRVAGTLGGREALSVGLALPGPRSR